jgi:lipid-A-disaccharide synthase
LKYYLIAGEASGDLHGSNLMKQLKLKDPNADFRFFGGDLMNAEGGKLVKHYREMAYMGFVEVAMNLSSILTNMDECKKDVLSYGPDVLILIDFPGFNLKIAEFAKQHHIQVCYYISPKIWAWNRKRVHKIKRLVDKMLCILPFEIDFYKQYDYHKAVYVGNPLMDAINAYPFSAGFKKNNQLPEKPIIALLPGSRKMELQKILPEMLKVKKHFPDHQFIIAGAPGFDESYYHQFNIDGFKLVFGQTYDLLKNAEAAIVTSGTATLETALLKVPQVVCYKANALSVMIARALVKINYISLVNLIMDKKVVTELIQEDCSEEKITKEISLILNDENYRSRIMNDYRMLADKVGAAGASEKAAEEIIKMVS